MADDIPLNEILLYDSWIVRADYYLQTHTTNPLLHRKLLPKAIETSSPASGI